MLHQPKYPMYTNDSYAISMPQVIHSFIHSFAATYCENTLPCILPFFFPGPLPGRNYIRRISTVRDTFKPPPSLNLRYEANFINILRRTASFGLSALSFYRLTSANIRYHCLGASGINSPAPSSPFPRECLHPSTSSIHSFGVQLICFTFYFLLTS